MASIKTIILNSSTEELESILSPFIEEQFPTFIRKDYRKLILFIKSYYEWLDKKGNYGNTIQKLSTIFDVDSNLDEFYSHFKATYLDGFPETFAESVDGNKPNKKTLLKHIRDFYGNKGTESSYQFLFKVLYDSELDFYYPKNDILKLSSGKWYEPLSVKCTSSNGSALYTAVGGRILQYSGDIITGVADIVDVIQYNEGGVYVTEFYIENLVGDFLPNTNVTIEKDETTWNEITYSVLGNYFIEAPGADYSVGDQVLVRDNNGRGFLANIQQVGLGGTLKKISIKSSGINYVNKVYVSFVSANGLNETAIVYFDPTAITRYPGYYLDNGGKLSSNKKIQDGHYYQDFSYELKSAVSLETYFNILKQLVHPSGMRMFGSILLKSAIDSGSTLSSQAVYSVVPLIGEYTPYTFVTGLNLRANGYGTSYGWELDPSSQGLCGESAGSTLGGTFGGQGFWLGATGDLYPLGYNPYIGSTLQVGINGKTAPIGTVFIGTSYGYTYCIVEENGFTCHNPLGSPLGSTTSWYSGNENTMTPENISGMVLWLKPENIGVCGSLVVGASLDRWIDASPMKNDATPATWDKFNTATTSLYTPAAVSGWAVSASTHQPITKMEFKPQGFEKSTHGQLFMAGLSRVPGATSTNYNNLDFGIYIIRSYGDPNGSTYATENRRSYLYEMANVRPDPYGAQPSSSTLGLTYEYDDDDLFSVEYNKTTGRYVYSVNGTTLHSGITNSGLTYYGLFAPYSAAKTSISVEGLYSGSTKITGPSWAVYTTGSNPSPPGTTTANTGITWTNLIGRPIHKTSPKIIVDAIGGTGAYFSGGLMFGPKSYLYYGSVRNYMPYSDDFAIGDAAGNASYTSGIAIGVHGTSMSVPRPPDYGLEGKGIYPKINRVSIYAPNLVTDPYAASALPQPFQWAGYEGTATRVTSGLTAALNSVSSSWVRITKNSSSNGRVIVSTISGLQPNQWYRISMFVWSGDTNLTSIGWQADAANPTVGESTQYTSADRGTVKKIEAIFCATASGGTPVMVCRIANANPIGTEVYVTGLSIINQTRQFAKNWVESAGIGNLTGNTYTSSLYAKVGTTGMNRFAMSFSTAFGSVSGEFNITEGNASCSAPSGCTAGIQDVGLGWHRCWISGRNSKAFANAPIPIYVVLKYPDGVGYSQLGTGITNGDFMNFTGWQVERAYDKGSSDSSLENSYGYAMPMPYVGTTGSLFGAPLAAAPTIDKLKRCTFVPGGTGEKLILSTALHFNRGITFTDEMDWFMVFKNATESTTNSYMLFSNNGYRYTHNNDDWVFATRPWNTQDRTVPPYPLGTTVSNSSYWHYPLDNGKATADTQRMYYNYTGIFFRPYRSDHGLGSPAPTTYDPHYGGISAIPHIAELGRDATNRLYLYLNGDLANQYSRSTGIGVVDYSGTRVADPIIYQGGTFDVSRIGSYNRRPFVSGGPDGSSRFVSLGLNNTPYSWIGTVFEILVFDRKLSETERQTVYGYLSRKYKLEPYLPDSYILSHPSTYQYGTTYWNIANHPNTRSFTGIPPGTNMGGITISAFLEMPTTVYKSAGTRLASGAVLAGDTYDTIGA